MALAIPNSNEEVILMNTNGSILSALFVVIVFYFIPINILIYHLPVDNIAKWILCYFSFLIGLGIFAQLG